MLLTPNSKDFLDVSKRTIVAKVKLFFYHRHTFQLDSCYGKEGTCVNPLSSALRLALAVQEMLVFFVLELIVTLYVTLFSSFFMIIHLVAIILSNLAGFARLVDIKYVFEKTNGLNSWVSDSVRTFCLFAEEMVIFFELELIVTLYVTLFSSF